METFLTFARNESEKDFISKILFIFQKWKDYRDLCFPGFCKNTITYSIMYYDNFKLKLKKKKICILINDRFLSLNQLNRKNVDRSICIPVIFFRTLRKQYESKLFRVTSVINQGYDEETTFDLLSSLFSFFYVIAEINNNC